MKKYTQRELHNEAFRDMLRGLKNVAKAGIKGAAKNVAKYISPELYDMAKSARDIYKGSQPGESVLKDYLQKTRSVPVYLRTVPIQKIIDGDVDYVFQDTSVRDLVTDPTGNTRKIIPKNAYKLRLQFKKAGKEEAVVSVDDGIFKIPFEASSREFFAYIDKTDKDKQQLIAIQDK